MDKLDLKFYWSVFLRRLPYFLVIAGALSAIGVTVAMILPPVYRSSASMLVEPQQIPGELAQSTVPVNPFEQVQIIEQRLMTRANLIALADRIGLYADEPELSAGARGRRHARAHRVHRLHARRDPRAARPRRHHHRRRLRGADAGVRQQGRQRARQPRARGERQAPHRPGRRHAAVLRERGRAAPGRARSARPRRSPPSRPRTSRRCPTASTARRNRQILEQERLLALEREESALKNQRATVVWVFERTGRSSRARGDEPRGGAARDPQERAAAAERHLCADEPAHPHAHEPDRRAREAGRGAAGRARGARRQRRGVGAGLGPRSRARAHRRAARVHRPGQGADRADARRARGLDPGDAGQRGGDERPRPRARQPQRPVQRRGGEPRPGQGRRAHRGALQGRALLADRAADDPGQPGAPQAAPDRQRRHRRRPRRRPRLRRAPGDAEPLDPPAARSEREARARALRHHPLHPHRGRGPPQAQPRWCWRSSWWRWRSRRRSSPCIPSTCRSISSSASFSPRSVSAATCPPEAVWGKRGPMERIQAAIQKAKEQRIDAGADARPAMGGTGPVAGPAAGPRSGRAAAPGAGLGRARGLRARPASSWPGTASSPSPTSIRRIPPTT